MSAIDTQVAVAPGERDFWTVPLSHHRRVFDAAWRLGLGLAISGWLGAAQVQNNARGAEWLWTIGIAAFAIWRAMKAYRRTERVVFATAVIHYTPAQRLKRSWAWVVLPLFVTCCVWFDMWAREELAERWWYMWPALFPIGVGVRFYFLKSERVISARAQTARAALQAEATQFSLARAAEVEERIGGALNVGVVRYTLAALLFWGAWYLAFEDTGRKSGWLAMFAVLAGFYFARELGKWLLGLGLLLGVGWLLFAGIASLPVSVAIIIGALIIASAVKNR